MRLWFGTVLYGSFGRDCPSNPRFYMRNLPVYRQYMTINKIRFYGFDLGRMFFGLVVRDKDFYSSVMISQPHAETTE